MGTACQNGRPEDTGQEVGGSDPIRGRMRRRPPRIESVRIASPRLHVEDGHQRKARSAPRSQSDGCALNSAAPGTEHSFTRHPLCRATASWKLRLRRFPLRRGEGQCLESGGSRRRNARATAQILQSATRPPETESSGLKRPGARNVRDRRQLLSLHLSATAPTGPWPLHDDCSTHRPFSARDDPGGWGHPVIGS